MAKEHVEADLQFKLVGHHEGIFTADIDWNENNVGQVEGTVDLKAPAGQAGLHPLRHDPCGGRTGKRRGDPGLRSGYLSQ